MANLTKPGPVFDVEVAQAEGLAVHGGQAARKQGSKRHSKGFAQGRPYPSWIHPL